MPAMKRLRVSQAYPLFSNPAATKAALSAHRLVSFLTLSEGLAAQAMTHPGKLSAATASLSTV